MRRYHFLRDIIFLPLLFALLILLPAAGQGDTAGVPEGIIALQLHAPGNFHVEFKDIYIQPLNESFIIPEAQKVYLNNGDPVDIGRKRRAVFYSISDVNAGILTLPFFGLREMEKRLDIVISSLSGRGAMRYALFHPSNTGARLDVSHLAPGYYIAHISGDQKEIFTGFRLDR